MKRNIGRKFLVGLIVFTLLLAGSICLIVSKQYEQRTIEKYEYIGFSLTDSASALIDGDRVEKYLETGEPDDYYREMIHQLSLLADAFEPQ